AIELVVLEQPPQQRADVVVVRAQEARVLLDALARRRQALEVRDDLARDEARAGRLLQDRVDALVAVELARDAEERLLAEVVIEPAVREAALLVAPAGERARRFLDVGLGVVAVAEREELHQLARPVLVRVRL